MYSRYRDIGHKFGGVKDVPQAAMRTFMLWAVVGVISAVLGGDLPDEDADEKNIGLGPVNTIPIVRDVGNAAYNQLIGIPYGYKISPLESIGYQTAKTAKTAKGVVMGDKEIEELYKDLFITSSYYIGIPGASQMNITGVYLYDLLSG